MTHDDSYLVPVQTAIPNHQYKRLRVIAKKHNTTVAELVRVIVDRQMGRILTAAAPAVAKTGNYGHRLTPDDIARIGELNGQGLNDTDIAQIMHCNSKTIAHHRLKLGLPKRSDKGRKKKEATP